jgi:predicted nucleic acid-binding protein
MNRLIIQNDAVKVKQNSFQRHSWLQTFCIDPRVLLAYLTPEDNSKQAETLVLNAIAFAILMIAPSFAGAEVGLLTRQKVGRGLIDEMKAKYAV